MLGSCCCMGIGEACKTDSKSSRIPYILTFVTFASVAFILTLVGDKQIVDLPFVNYDTSICASSCARNGAIYRIGLCLTLFFATHFLVLCIPGMGCFHTFVYLIKLVVLTAIVIWSFWWDADAVEAFGGWARWFSFFFIIIQAFMLICWAYDTHNAMMARMLGTDGEEAEGNVKYAYVGLCLVLVVACFTFIGLFFTEYGQSGCSTNQAILSLSVIYFVLQMIASYFVEHGNGFVSSVVAVYITYLCFQALATNTDVKCQSPGWSDKAPMYSGFFILIATLSFVGYETRMLDADERKEVEGEDADIEAGNTTAGTAHDTPSMRKLNRFFHLTMTMGSFYITMIMTNWGLDAEQNDTRWYGYPANMWLITVGQWFTMLLYMWVLFAPRIFPDREFGFE